MANDGAKLEELNEIDFLSPELLREMEAFEGGNEEWLAYQLNKTMKALRFHQKNDLKEFTKVAMQGLIGIKTSRGGLFKGEIIAEYSVSTAKATLAELEKEINK